VALSWTAPASDGGDAISHYEVSGDNGSTWVTASTSTSHTFTGLTNGTEYTFKVRAINSAGNGPEVSATATPTEYVCEIGATKYATLDDALAAVTSGQTIKLLNNITHTSPIEIDSKTIYFELGDYDLLVDTSANPDESIYYVLAVKNGGKIRLAGTGIGKFNVKSSSNSISYGIQVLDANSEVTVNNVDVTGEGAIGIYMYGSGDFLDGGTITVNGHLNAGDMGVKVNAKNGNVVINGDIETGHSGIQTATNEGTSVTVNGNITVLGTTWQDLDGAGILASGLTTVQVSGNVTGQGTDYIGVYALGGTIEIDGNVVSSGIGAKATPNFSYGNGAVTIDGSLSAGTPFIIVGTTEKSAADITEPTTKPGFLTYSDGTSNVWIGSVGGPVVTTPAAPQNFTATPGDGQVSLNWAAPVSDGGSAILKYQISKDNGANWTDVGLNTSHTFSGLTNGTEYTFKVRAVNSVGPGAEASTAAMPIAAPAGPDVTPSSLNITTGSTGTFTISLGQNGNEADNATVASNNPSVATVNPANVTISGQTVTVTGVSAGTTTITIGFSGGSYTGADKIVSVTVTDQVCAPHTVNFHSDSLLYASKTVTSGSALGANWPNNPSKSGYSFDGWFTGSNGAGTMFTSSTIINADVALYAKWTYIGGSSGSGRGRTPSVPTYQAQVKAGSDTERALRVTVNNNTGNASIEEDPWSTRPQGRTIVTIPSIPDTSTYSVSTSLANLSTTDVQSTLTFNTDVGNITVSSNMLNGIENAEGSNAQITIGMGDKSNLPEEVEDSIGERPLVQLTLSIDGKQMNWNNPEAPVTVSIPYTPTDAELAHPESIVVWYIDASGNIVTIPNGQYDPETRTVTFTTTHFSYYAVGYNQVNFKDVANDAWYAKAVSFIAAREITTGTGSGYFSPEAKLTRGQFIVMLMKAYSIAPDLNPKDNFADAGSAYYTSYLAAAKRMGISAGVGNNMFAPKKEITRQEMFTLLFNALNVIGQLPQGDSDKTLGHFSDAGQIDSWAKEAMTLLVKTGTIGGNAGKLNPTSTTTRAEMAQVLYNLLGK
jgi:uncharacterized repeat protein (TIGR02543 family)